MGTTEYGAGIASDLSAQAGSGTAVSAIVQDVRDLGRDCFRCESLC